MLKIDKSVENQEVIRRCDEFLKSKRPKYVLGRNERAKAIAKLVDIDGFVDDFAVDAEYQGRPVVKTHIVPSNALILITSICNPLSAQKTVTSYGLESIDYFSFLKYSKLPLPDIEFQPAFASEFEKNRDKYEKIYEKFYDRESKNQFLKILNFRLNLDIKYMQGFTNNEKNQYFEDFLHLQRHDEVFVDAGGFDGYTTAEFIRHCPDYKKVYLFEPDASNLEIAKKNLRTFGSIDFYPLGLYSEKANFRFSKGGSASRISKEGEIEIHVEALDNLIDEPVTFIKMDIEGAEIDAIKGAEGIISKYKPRLAISAYHKPDDFWKIPEAVFSIRDDYKIYLRHYMEGVTETVMFFV